MNAPSTQPAAAKKKETPAPVVDAKKEKMKQDLFSGIYSGKKDSDDSSDDGKGKTTTQPDTSSQPAGEMNLLDFDTPTEMPSNNAAPVQSNSNNLLDLMGDSNEPPKQQDVGAQLDSILGGNMFQSSAPQQPPSPPALKYQGISGFSTAQFGQTWMQMSAPGAEQKFSLAPPLAMSS